jgi:hypothetical protein
VDVKRLRLSHNYHDSVLRSVQIEDRRLTFVIDLDPHWNNKVPERRHLFFEGVRNIEEVLHGFGQTAEAKHLDLADEIIGIARNDDGRILVDLMKAGAIYIDCKSIGET